MSFADIYNHQVFESRRTRSQRAQFWARVVSLALMLMVGVVLRTEPDLRRALAEAGMSAVMQVTGRSTALAAAQDPAADPSTITRPKDRIKVNRPATDASLSTQSDTQGLANQVQGRLSSTGVNGG